MKPDRNKFRKILQERLKRMDLTLLAGLEEFLERHELKMRWKLEYESANWYDEHARLAPRESGNMVVTIYGPASWPSMRRRLFPDHTLGDGPLYAGIEVSKETAMKAIVLGDLP